jgi:hypothetical protein
MLPAAESLECVVVSHPAASDGAAQVGLLLYRCLGNAFRDARLRGRRFDGSGLLPPSTSWTTALVEFFQLATEFQHRIKVSG